MENVENILAKATAKILDESQRLGEGIPYLPAEDGKYDDIGARDIAWWTNGFFAGTLWQLYSYTKNEAFRRHAEVIEERLDQAMDEFYGLHHDVGFMWLHTSVANYRITENEKAKLRGLKAANMLAGRYNPKGQFIRAWNDDKTGWAIIDCLLNIPLLYWATEETGDPRFKEIAMNHADTVEKYVIRKDGSSGHIASFDPATGEFIELIGGQGYDGQSAWSRGQSWALYGFTLSYKHTQKELYLETALRVANYFIANVEQTNNIPRVDFKAPVIDQDTDTSAALIASCGLLELASVLPPYQGQMYKQAAENIIQAVIENFADFGNEIDGIVAGGAVAYHEPEGMNTRLIYSDYYLVEALLRLENKQVDLW